MRILYLVCCFVLLSTTARANHIGIFADQIGGLCSGTPGYPLYTVYVVAMPSNAIKAAAFKVDATLPAGLTSFGASPLWGICEFNCNPFEGAVAYRTCATSTWPLYSLTFFNNGAVLDGSCNHLTVTSFPGESSPLLYDCADNPIAATGGSFSFIFGPGLCNDCVVATEPTTWGSVKALYR